MGGGEKGELSHRWMLRSGCSAHLACAFSTVARCLSVYRCGGGRRPSGCVCTCSPHAVRGSSAAGQMASCSDGARNPRSECTEREGRCVRPSQSRCSAYVLLRGSSHT